MMDFTPGFSSATLFQNEWGIISGTYDTTKQKADYMCTNSNSDSVGVFSPYYSIYPNGFKINTKKYQQPYQFTYVDILYFVKTYDFIDLTLIDGSTQVAAVLLGDLSDLKNQECNYKVSCNSSSKTDVIRQSLSYNKKFSSTFPTVTFTYNRTPVKGDWFGLLKIVIWSNCVENCLTCSDSKNCKICMKGFNRYTLSNGVKICEENTGCSTSNCFSCIKSTSLNLNQCVKCLPGYTLDNSNKCQLSNPAICSSSQYYSIIESKCVNYQSLCLMQTSNQYNQWQNCLQPVDISSIKCPKEKTVLIYEQKNYGVFACDCKVDFCDICTSISTCSQCKIGYILNAAKTICTFNSCPLGYTQDPDSLLCIANCSGTNCQNCDLTKCLACLQNGNYYIDQNNPKNCLLCTITNCQICSGEGKCSQCNIGYTLSTDKLSCQLCSVQNCSSCQNGSSSLCNTCVVNFLKSPDSTNCKCNVSGCQVCESFDGSKCHQCVNNYITNIDKCECQVKNCQNCDPTDGSNCIACNFGLTYNSTNKTCFCAIQNCSKCSSIQVGQCDTCITNYTLSNDKLTCSCSVLNCQNCDPQNGNACLICNSGYFVDSTTKQCKNSLTNCQTVNSLDTSKCDVCSNNYQLDSISKQCVCQVLNCKLCSATDGSICSMCVQNYTTSQCICGVDKCDICNQQDGQICDQCHQGYQWNTLTQKCEGTALHCFTYNDLDGSKCDACNTDYSLNSQTKLCECKLNNCKQCDINPNLCQICQNGYVQRTQGQCECQVENCSNCISNGICQQCSTNYVKSIDGFTCSCNDANCQTCDHKDGFKCLTCNTGYILDASTQKCFAKIDNCQSYDLIDKTKCLSCSNNYGLDSTNKLCNCQVPNCQQCSLTDGLSCSICTKNYITNQCKCQVLNCSQCSSTDGSICVTCQTGFQWNSATSKCEGTAKYCSQFNSMDGSLCEVCISNYNLNTSSKQCECQIQNCSRCDNSQNICDSCFIGYTQRVQGKCECQVLNCQTCSQNGLCQQCYTDYEIDQTALQIGSSCKVICSLQNCIECEDPPNNKISCKKCQTGFIVDPRNKKCVQIPCQVQNCDQCYPNNPNSCNYCKSGYDVQLTTLQNYGQVNTCFRELCKVNGCLQCSTTDNNFCQQCNSKLTLSIDNKVCQAINLNGFQVVQKKTYNGYNVTVEFQEDLVNNNQINYQNVFDFKITGISNYKYQVKDVKIKQVLVYIEVDENCKNQKLEVQVIDPLFSQINNIQVKQGEVDLDYYAVETPEQKKQAEAAKIASQNIQTTLLSSMLPIAMIGNFYVLFNTIDLTTLIYFLLFVNVRYPSNVINFCSVFQNFQMAFIPNLFQAYFTNEGYLQPYTPGKFLEYGNDAYFLNSAGQSYTIVFGILLIYLILKIFSFIKITGVQQYIQKKIESGWEFNAFFDLIWTVYMYIVVGVFLQFYKFEFTDSLCFLNYTLFAMSFVAIFLIPICITIFISKTPDLSNERIQKQFSSLVGGLKVYHPGTLQQSEDNQIQHQKSDEEILKKPNSSQKSLESPSDNLKKHTPKSEHQNPKKLSLREERTIRYSKYTNILLYFRKIAYSIFIIFMFSQPYFQLLLISLLNLFLVFFYFYICPHDKSFENIRNGLSEAILVIMQIAVGFLVEDRQDQDEQERINIGWVLIGCAGVILFMHIITVVLDLLKSLFNLIKDFFLTVYQSISSRKNKKQISQEDQQKNTIHNLIKLPIGELASQIAMPFVRSNTRHLSSKILSQNKFTPRKGIRRSTTSKIMGGQVEKDLQIGSKKDLSHNFGYNIPENFRESQKINVNNGEVSSLDVSLVNSQIRLDHTQIDRRDEDDSSKRYQSRLKSANKNFTSKVKSINNLDHNQANMSIATINNLNQLSQRNLLNN